MRAFVKVVERFGLQRKILSITSDNGSNVIRPMKSLTVYTKDNPDWDIFDVNEQHELCLAHVLSLAAQALLGVNRLGTSAPATSGTLDCEDNTNDEHDNFWLNEGDSEEENSDEENNGGKDGDKTAINNNGAGAITKVALSKLRKAATTISITIYNDLMEAIEKFTRDKGNQRQYPDLIYGAEAAYEKLKQYYSATDKSPIYSVATTLHPFQRYQYWIDEEWDEEMVTDAKSAVRSVWARYQPKLGEDTTMAGMPSRGDSMAETDNIELRELYNRKRRRKEARKQHPDERQPYRDDELEPFATGRCKLQQPLSNYNNPYSIGNCIRRSIPT